MKKTNMEIKTLSNAVPMNSDGSVWMLPGKSLTGLPRRPRF